VASEARRWTGDVIDGQLVAGVGAYPTDPLPADAVERGVDVVAVEDVRAAIDELRWGGRHAAYLDALRHLEVWLGLTDDTMKGTNDG
jgi:hypothetical protein